MTRQAVGPIDECLVCVEQCDKLMHCLTLLRKAGELVDSKGSAGISYSEEFTRRHQSQLLSFLFCEWACVVLAAAPLEGLEFVGANSWHTCQMHADCFGSAHFLGLIQIEIQW